MFFCAIVRQLGNVARRKIVKQNKQRGDGKWQGLEVRIVLRLNDCIITV